jgi:HPt (histidine-containing phosphotransfer) domain-containing protein
MANYRITLAGGDQETARRLIHTLKGVSDTLGITAVHVQATELDKAIKEAQSTTALETLAQALEQAQTAALQTIAAMNPESAGPPPLGKAETDEQLARIEPLLAISDMAVNALVSQAASTLRATFGSIGERFLRQVDSFDYEQAMATLKNMRNLNL